MSAVLRIQAAIVKRGGAMSAAQLAQASGFTPAELGRHIHQMHLRCLITRTAGEQGRGYLYSMDDDQVVEFKRKAATLKAVVTAAGEPGGMCLVTDTDDIHDRLKFLRMLKDRTVFTDHAVLARIIEDYERTLKLRRACELRAESEEVRGRPRKMDYRERRAA